MNQVICFYFILRNVLVFVCLSTSATNASEFLRLPGTNSVAMLGQIESSDILKLSKYIEDGVTQIYLSSPGGSLDAAWRIGRLIYDNDVGVSLTDDVSCASACAIIFLHSPVRKMAASAQLGVHLPYIEGADASREEDFCREISSTVSTVLSDIADVIKFNEPRDFSDIEFNASHILVDTELLARAIFEELMLGGDFGEIAKVASTGPSGPNGGSLGWFGIGAMIPEFEAALFSLEVGQISEPVQSPFGWHVIKLNNVRPLQAPRLSNSGFAFEQCLTDAYQLGALEFLRIGDLIRQAGVEEDVLRKMVLTPSNSIYWFDYTESKLVGIVQN